MNIVTYEQKDWTMTELDKEVMANTDIVLLRSTSSLTVVYALSTAGIKLMRSVTPKLREFKNINLKDAIYFAMPINVENARKYLEELKTP